MLHPCPTERRFIQATITIRIIDVPEPPVFDSIKTVAVDENSIVPLVLGSLAGSATDQDAGSSITYELAAPSDTVSIDASGTITLLKSLDFEALGSLAIPVVAVDNTNLTGDVRSISVLFPIGHSNS